MENTNYTKQEPTKTPTNKPNDVFTLLAADGPPLFPLIKLGGKEFDERVRAIYQRRKEANST